MKQIKILLILVLVFSTTGLTAQQQQVANFTFLDVPSQALGNLIRLHKQVTDRTMEYREFKNHVLLTQFQGSGANVVIWSNYPSVEDVYKDNALSAFGQKWESLEGEEKESFEKLISEYMAYWTGHTDEIRVIDWDNNVKHSENMDWDTPLYALFGN